MKEFPKLYTKRLIITKLSDNDIPLLVKYANNKQISDNIVNIPYPYLEFHALMRMGYVLNGFKEQTRYCFAILLKDSQEFIGEISLHLTDQTKRIAELAYWIGEPFWNNGYVSEAIKPVIDFGFNAANYKIIYATCKVDNIASMKVLIKNNMKKFKETSFQLSYKITVEEFSTYLN